MARLTIIGPDGRHETDLQDHNTVGRHPNNTIQILDRIVSKEHLHIDKVEGRWVLTDLGSLNGTFINGEEIPTDKPTRFASGDSFIIGAGTFVVDLEFEK